MDKKPPTNAYSLARMIAAVMILLPVVVFSSLVFLATPDLETWLADKTKGSARSDAFESMTVAAPPFILVLGVTSFVAAYFVLSRNSQFLLPLSGGPLFGIISYLFEYGVTDPAWFTLMALLTIGMLVSTPVTIAWSVVILNRGTKLRSTGPTDTKQI